MSWYLSDGANTVSDCFVFVNKIIAAKKYIWESKGKLNYVGWWIRDWQWRDIYGKGIILKNKNKLK